MRNALPLVSLLVAPLLLANAEAPQPQQEPVSIPPAIRAMLDAALDSGNEGEVSTIVKYARAADPASGDAVLAIAEKWRTERAAMRNAAIAEAGPLDLWKGRAELGGFITTGNSDTFGATGIVDLQREGLRWRHKLLGQVDYQESLGITTRERYLAAYQPNYKFSARGYAFGRAQYESDRFLGYDNRFSGSVGVGYSVIQTAPLKLNIEGGPAFRYTEFTDGNIESSPAALASIDLDWRILPGLTLSQDASGYLQRFNSTISSNTAVAAKLIGPLSAQLSYNIQYESDPPLGRQNTDTIGRASLVYSF